ncbi:tRNA (adenosine(37)-N6)-threonylcarbamoyltransferase complex ATPase subunit type 1 TsaE [Limosilactobacillus reuteri]|uniref:tRNA (adenosine(37)-N6)-threonylcarbamoyltransferase complex ATPase subunit type 1 TsaE n=1 Tax=Limosilactobacillus reuteri TaxID=1598 RepID=UPI00128D4B50|nr:tRNA (adenosine(37)-N6)-threonylcarbamoyltransferase complex ATPase subunit type 1 TsaE [Limosilactobacillus reuteri]MCC4439753.1 tRNA (adenosine(37)-N6)-threonylcarbamoyltransferase complex ATPase subunit type 1 TsaE [Limosilactobacillus reuteri]MCC4499291.1 tRNA (adenosine(37)-N6)-threonylcarbamoyltransferase complex ATPase subunit type 1 TsaE [Limosilactobacillus reuteri]MCC4503554.1 tRNA (adenosine(37)-N6)-threonylcarbamoyltransferase complex ATPase subunit type 1 TsaE [Limosilactobacillu
MKSLTLTNRDATIALGKKIGQQLVAGDVLVLDGDLGAGKTTFTKGLAAGLEIPDIIKSPTFTIIHEYQDGRLPLYHMDAYRLENGGAEDLGLEEYFDGDGVSVVEWAEFVEDELPTDFLAIHFKRTGDDNTRILEFEPHGQHFDQIVKSVVKQWQTTFR